MFSSLSLYFASDVENLFILLFIEPALMDLLLLLEGCANSFVAPPGGGGSKHKSCDTKRAKFSIFFFKFKSVLKVKILKVKEGYLKLSKDTQS